MNIINAIINLVNNPIVQVTTTYKNKNRANNAGDALEEYVKDLFANTFDTPDEERHIKHSEVFSYLGNSNNPPDAMLSGGDAIETKQRYQMTCDFLSFRLLLRKIHLPPQRKATVT